MNRRLLRPRLLTLGIMCCSITLLSCREITLPNAPVEAANAVNHLTGTSDRFKTLDAEFLELALAVPTFGGLYLDESGAAHVYLSDIADGPRYRPAIAAFVRRLRLVNPSGEPMIVFERGKFHYPDLSAAYSRIKLGLPRGGITQTDIDERHNRITIGTIDSRVAATVAQIVSNLRLEPAMISVQVRAPTVVNADLTDRVRPTVGGLQIFASIRCGLGFNARVGDAFTGVYSTSRYFITASHCTTSDGRAADGANNGVVFGQPTVANRIGFEVFDPGLFQNSYASACRLGRNCRYSDAALIQYDDSVSDRMGILATTSGALPATIVGTLKVYTKNYSAVGATAYAISSSYGTRTGSIDATCVDVTQYHYDPQTALYEDTGVDMLCQDQATYGSQPGDSGGPVYARPYPSQPAAALGLHWGAATGPGYPTTLPLISTFSPIGYVLGEISKAISERTTVEVVCNGLASDPPGCPP
ncbi:MAG TPA: trypsin-like serine protease [Gemmatimonadaceae bacterium]|nr:trypsin-like serine protease [Gemmatimonadaceae bacterium]